MRKSSLQEEEYYNSFLYPFQDEIFSMISCNNFYLSGGTCLSRFYYNHRYSEDLDFFYDGYKYPQIYFETLFREIVNKIGNRFNVDISISGDLFKRIFVFKDNCPLKIEFNFENYRNIGDRIPYESILIDTKENIATNKITAIYDRKMEKDFFDLYFLLKDIDLYKTIEWSKYKIVPLDYEGTLLAFSNSTLEGEVIAKVDVDIEEFNRFIKKLIRDLLKYARDT